MNAIVAVEDVSARRVWITWEHHTRSHSLSGQMKAHYVVISAKAPRPIRYLRCMFRTLVYLLRTDAEVIFVQSPSIFLALSATVWGKLSRRTVIVDAHNAGVFPLEGRSRVLSFVAQTSLRLASLVIVTTESLKRDVESLGARAFVLMDPLPERYAGDASSSADSRISVTCVTTWAADEPIDELLAAAHHLPKEWLVYYTGRVPPHIRAMSLAKNVRLTGFLQEEDYIALIKGSTCVVDLTTRENCLVCGAYEALAAARPLVVTRTRALESAFSSAACFTENEASAIASAVEHVVQRSAEYSDRSSNFAKEFRKQWEARRLDLEALLKGSSER